MEELNNLNLSLQQLQGLYKILSDISYTRNCDDKLNDLNINLLAKISIINKSNNN